MVTTQQDWLDAQVGVLGSVLIEPKLAAKVIAETDEGDYTGQFQSVYAAIKAVFLSGRPADPVLVNNQMGGAYAKLLMEIMEVTPSAASVDYYISACKRRGRLLRLRSLGEQLQASESIDDAAQLLETANKTLIHRSGVRIVSMEEAMTSFYERHEGKKEYLSWPIDGLDEKLYAEPGDFIILGGYPSDGKSALALQTAYHMAAKKRVGFFSLETNDRKLFDRLISHAAGIPMDKLKTNSLANHHWDSAAKQSSGIIARNLEFISAAGMTVADIQAVTYAQRYDVIFVDYLQLISGRGKDRFSIVTDISISLHTMAQSTGVAIVALAQLSRPEKRKDGIIPPPDLSSLRESGQIEQDADIVFMLYRPSRASSGRMLLIQKNKEGELGSISLDFDGLHQTFRRNSSDKYSDLQKRIKQAGIKQYERLPDDAYVPESFLRDENGGEA